MRVPCHYLACELCGTANGAYGLLRLTSIDGGQQIGAVMTVYHGSGQGEVDMASLNDPQNGARMDEPQPNQINGQVQRRSNGRYQRTTV
jgi:hypothetical protein